MTSDLNRKRYSVDNYENFTKQDLYMIRSGLEEARIKIIRFLGQKKAREKKEAKTYEEIAKYMQKTSPDKKYSLQAARKHCKILNDIGVIYQTRSKSHDEPSPSWSGEYIKFYLVVENVIEIYAILTAAMLGVGKREAAIRIYYKLLKEFNTIPDKDKFKFGIYVS